MILLFDTETTDLVHNTLLPIKMQPRIIEFYGVMVDDQFRQVNELDFLCNPGIPISDEVQRITGIDDAAVADKPSFAVHADEVIGLLEEADEWVAHNLSYDEFVLSVELKRCGKAMPSGKIRTCTVEATEWINGYRMKLADLYEQMFSEKLEGAHRAKNDVLATLRCFQKLREEGEI